MKCEKCGAEFDGQPNFCPECGFKISVDVSKDKADTQNEVKLVKEATTSELQLEPMMHLNPKKMSNGLIVQMIRKNDPNYGRNLSQMTSGYVPPKSGGFSIAGFILSLCAVMFGYLSFICLILGLTFSSIGLGKCQRGTGSKKGFAIAGIVISLVLLVLFGLYAFVF